jgi:hypothetical protein
MSYAIIGFGNIGQALAKAFARSGIEVSVATTRGPESFASAAAAIGPTIIPKKLAGSGQGGHRLFGCPFRIAPGCREGAADLEGKDGHRCDELVSSPT